MKFNIYQKLWLRQFTCLNSLLRYLHVYLLWYLAVIFCPPKLQKKKKNDRESASGLTHTG